MRPIRAPTLTDSVKLVLLGAIWGSAFICVEIGLQGFPPLTLAASRLLLSAMLLLCLAFTTGKGLPQAKRDWGILLVAGLLNATLPFLLIAWGQQHISSALAAILLGAQPFMALLLSHWMTADDRITRAKVIGMALGFSGILFILGDRALQGIDSSLWGKLAILLAALGFTVSALITRKVSHLTPETSSAAALSMAALYMTPIALLIERPSFTGISLEAWSAVIFLGVVSSGVAALLRFQLIRDTGITFLSQVSYLIPLFGVFWSWLFLGHVPAASAWIALVLIFAGLAISRLRPAGMRQPGALAGSAARED